MGLKPRSLAALLTPPIAAGFGRRDAGEDAKTEKDRRPKTEVKPLITIHQIDPKITKKPTTSPSEGSSKNCPVPCALSTVL